MTTLEAIREQRARTLPRGWRWESLSNVLLALESGSRPPGGAVGITSGVPSISAEQMTERGGFDFSVMRYVPCDYYAEMKRGHIHEGDILVVKDGATTGKTCIVDGDFPFEEAVVNEHVFICRPNPDIVMPRFLFYWLWSPPGNYSIRSTFQGAAIGGINQRFADVVKVPVAPMREQERIVATLDEQMSAVQNARVADHARLEAAMALPASLLREVFDQQRKRRWPRKRLSTLATLLPSRSVTSGGDAEVLVITTACLSERGFLPDGIKKARMQSEHVEECVVRAGEILVARSNTAELVGRASLYAGVPSGVVASDLTIRIWPAEEIVRPPFLAAYLSFLYQSGFWRDKAGGASGSMKKITRSQLLGLAVPVPDITEQDAVIRFIESSIPVARRLRESCSEELEAIGRMPAALIRKAFNGAG